MTASWKPKELFVLIPNTLKDSYTIKIVRVLAYLMALNPEFNRKSLTHSADTSVSVIYI